MRIIGLKNCDTCRAALKALGAVSDAVLVDVRAEPIGRDEIARYHAVFGPALVNTRSATWRGLDEAARGMDPVDLIAAHPAVMKRPVIEAGDQLYLGWGPEVRAALLGEA
jgi:arsenate reductase